MFTSHITLAISRQSRLAGPSLFRAGVPSVNGVAGVVLCNPL